jgi:hypothetical protein
MDPGGVGVKKQKKPKRTPPLPIENKFVDRTSRGKECICLSCNQKLLAQKGHQDKQVRWYVSLTTFPHSLYSTARSLAHSLCVTD